MKTFNLKNLTPNPHNPRVLRDTQYRCLLESIKRDPAFLDKRPIVFADGIILGGNQRYQALLEATRDREFRDMIGTRKAGEVPLSWVVDASDWDDDRRKRFVLIDNAPDGMSGEWDWDVLANEFDVSWLNDLGLAVPEVELQKVPPQFPSIGEDIKTNRQCPSCGYRWSEGA